MGLFVTKPLAALHADAEKASLRRALGAGQLIALGIGAIVGAGIFTITGVAAATKAGPAVTISFIAAAIGCAFAGICYSEFATMIPIAGSAYTYAYATMGELIAWIIGWDLVLEYAVGAATVSISWSSTLVSILRDFGITLPVWLMASRFEPVTLPDGTVAAGFINLPAVAIVVGISLLLIVGIQESARANAIIVVLKVGVVIGFILLGWKYITAANYTPYIPPPQGPGEFGWGGILAGAGMIFFAYIGFDAVSTAAQEAKNPQRDMPIGIIGSLVICTVLYILYAHVLTGVVNYKDLRVAAPLAVAVDRLPYPILGEAMKIGSLLGLTSVMLVMLLGQSRVFFSMSKDGLLPALFSKVHPAFRTPYLSNVILMIFVSVFAAFAPLAIVGNLTSIGTLFAFVIVCIAIIIMRKTQPDLPRPFKTPFVPVVPILGVLVNLGLMLGLGKYTWRGLIFWSAIGLVVYFSYSRKHSRARIAR